MALIASAFYVDNNPARPLHYQRKGLELWVKSLRYLNPDTPIGVFDCGSPVSLEKAYPFDQIVELPSLPDRSIQLFEGTTLYRYADNLADPKNLSNQNLSMNRFLLHCALSNIDTLYHVEADCLTNMPLKAVIERFNNSDELLAPRMKSLPWFRLESALACFNTAGLKRLKEAMAPSWMSIGGLENFLSKTFDECRNVLHICGDRLESSENAYKIAYTGCAGYSYLHHGSLAQMGRWIRQFYPSSLIESYSQSLQEVLFYG